VSLGKWEAVVCADLIMEDRIQDGSTVAPLAAVVLVVMAYLIWTLPRRFAICPLLATTCLVPLGQQLVLFGLHFPLFRLLLLVGALRVIVRGEAVRLEWARADKLFVWWALVTVVFGTISNPTLEQFVNRSGDAYNAVGCYFFVRCVVLDFEDIVIGVRTLAFLSLPLAALMLVEKLSGHNLLSVFGGVPEITVLRQGHLRCQGAFRHPILAGMFGATQVPLFAALWCCHQRYRRLAVIAIVSAAAIVIFASSSGAVMAGFAAVAGLGLWNARRYLRVIRWGVVVMTLVLAAFMNAPVWYLMAKLGNIFGGEGWHRSWLIDQTISHFNEWWLFGTTYTAHWGPAGEVIATDPNMMDITNHYVMEGVKGGVLKLGLFVAIIATGFRGLARVLRSSSIAAQPAGFFVWSIGVSLFVYCVSFVSITYFDQSIVVWFWLLAVIASIPLINPAARRQTSIVSRFEPSIEVVHE
jgi:hypothetical protein